MIEKLVAALLSGVLGASLPSAIGADEEDATDGEPLRCVSMNGIRATTIVDDRHLLFRQSSGRVYLNRLDRECVGLARAGKFTYEVQSGARHVRLCASDSITVLERTGRGFNCGLGEFEPISADAAENLVNGPNRAVVSIPVELPERAAPPNAAEPAAEPAPQ